MATHLENVLTSLAYLQTKLNKIEDFKYRLEEFKDRECIPIDYSSIEGGVSERVLGLSSRINSLIADLHKALDAEYNYYATEVFKDIHKDINFTMLFKEEEGITNE